MENGLGSVDTPNLVEKALDNEIIDSKVEGKATDNEIIDSKVEGKATDNVIMDSKVEGKVTDNEIMDSKVEGKAKIVSHESKDLEGDQDFEDSIEAETPEVSSEDVVISPVDDMGKANDLDSSMAAHKKTDSEIDFEQFEEAVEVPVDVNNEEKQPVDNLKVEEVNNGEGVMEKNRENECDIVDNDTATHKKTDSGIDFEQFEEAVEIPGDVDDQAEHSASIEDTREVFMGMQPVDKPKVEEISNGGGEKEKNKGNEFDRMEDDMPVHEKTDSGIDFEKFEEAVEVPVDVRDQKEKSAGVTNDESVIEKNEEDGFDRMENDVAVSTTEDEVIEISEISTADADKEITKEEVVKEVDTVAVYDKEIQEDVIVEKRENGVSNDVDLEGTLAREVSDNGRADVEKISIEEPKAAQIVLRADSDSSQAVEFVKSLDEVENGEEANELLSSLDNGHKDKWSCENGGDAASGIHIDTKLEGEKNRGEVKEEIAEIPNSFHENGTNEEAKDTVTSAEDNRVESSEELRRDLATPIVDHHLTNGKPESSEVKELPVSEVVAVKRVEKVRENASDKGVERANGGESVDSPNVDTKKGGILGAKVTQGQNGPSEIKPKTNVFENFNTPPARPAGLGRAAPLSETSPRVVQQNRANGTSSHTQSQIIDDLPNGEAEEHDETREKLQMIRVKFLRLAHRLGQTPHNVVVAQVLYRLGLAEQLRGRNGGRVAGFSFDRASAMAEQLEANGQEPLDFSCTIMVLGKSGVGKSATINSIFDEVKFPISAFQNSTKKVQDVVGTVQGIKVRVIDTPGLLPSWSDQRQNEKILLSVKQFIKKTPPDIVLYLDRLDMQTRDLGDMPLLRTITDVFGPSIWFNAIVVLTHAASAPPEGANGTATSYDMFVTNRSHVVQQAIRQAAGDMRLMNPVSLVENHSACRKNRAGQRVLPNGQVWKPHLLLLSFASKILAEANTLLKLQDSPPGRPFAARTRAPPLPFLLSSLLQSRPSPKLPEEQFGDDDVLDEDIDDSSDLEDESEYDEFPPFKRLTKDQIGKLSKNQKKSYYEELEYREKLFMKKQLKEEKKRRKMMKKMTKTANEMANEYNDNIEEESGGAASVPVPMPDLALPASFDSDNPTHRYRYLDSPNQWVVRPVLDSHGWDHDIGYEGVNVEKQFVVKEKIPMSFSGQITKDKKDANMQMEIASSIKHGEGKATSLGLDMMSLGKDMAYTLRSETKFMNFKKNKATVGLSVTKLGDTVSSGVKIEDQLVVNKRLRIVASGGAMMGRGDMAYGGSFEATLRDKDHPLGRSLSTLGLSVMDWHGDLAIGGNIQSQIPVGRSTNLIARANLNNKGSGQVSIRLNSSEQLQIVLVALVPLIRKALAHVQLSQFGQ